MMKVVGLGAGGHAKVVIETLQLLNCYELVGLLDAKQELWGTKVLGFPVLGDDSLLLKLYNQGIHGAFIGVGAVRDVGVRRRLFLTAADAGFTMLQLIHPQAYVAPSARLGCGVVVLPGAVLNSDVVVGDNVVVYSRAVIEHESVLEDHVHISPGVSMAGGVHVEAEVFVGIGAVIIQGVRIGRGAVVGAGAVVIADVPAYSTVVGVPARTLRAPERDR